MKYHPFISALLASSVASLAIQRDVEAEAASTALYTIETAPGETQQVTEAEKWALKQVILPISTNKNTTN